ncbi:lipid-A-disaccharide synthase N-terminal domain-containing protein [Nitrospira sp. Kam-Ns4a]
MIPTTTTELLWLGIGFLGQTLFFMRWVVQWFVSERSAESRVPVAFWYFSLIGGLITLAYAIYRKDPVFIAGQAVGALIYVRNLMLIFRSARAARPASPAPGR